MELKQRKTSCASVRAKLLIEPYGIETGVLWLYQSRPLILLIEPYGIETRPTCLRG